MKGELPTKTGNTPKAKGKAHYARTTSKKASTRAQTLKDPNTGGGSKQTTKTNTSRRKKASSTVGTNMKAKD